MHVHRFIDLAAMYPYIRGSVDWSVQGDSTPDERLEALTPHMIHPQVPPSYLFRLPHICDEPDPEPAVCVNAIRICVHPANLSLSYGSGKPPRSQAGTSGTGTRALAAVCVLIASHVSAYPCQSITISSLKGAPTDIPTPNLRSPIPPVATPGDIPMLDSYSPKLQTCSLVDDDVRGSMTMAGKHPVISRVHVLLSVRPRCMRSSGGQQLL